MFVCKGYALADADASLAPISFSRRDPRADDVAMEILFCGVCHADIELSRGKWGFAKYPCVPGHEIVGRVTSVGSNVTRYRTGDLVGVGPLVDSCRTCAACRDGFEQLCDTGFTPTYMGPDPDFGHTYGGYSSHIVVDQNYVVRIPEAIEPARAAPLLCAGITAYAPLARAGVAPGKTVGVVGIGGVGHMGLKFARAMGANVIALTTSAAKGEDALRLGAHDVLVTRDAAAMAASKETFDFILSTVSVPYDLDPYLALLKRQSELCLVGTPEQVRAVPLSMVFRQKRMSGSFIGGIGETQAMLDFAARTGVAADIELIAIDRLNEAWARMIDADVRYRFVVDMATLPRAAAVARG